MSNCSGIHKHNYFSGLNSVYIKYLLHTCKKLNFFFLLFIHLTDCISTSFFFQHACELILDVIAALQMSSQSTDLNNDNHFVYGSGRHLVLVPCTETEILPYCIQMLLTCFKVPITSLDINKR